MNGPKNQSASCTRGTGSAEIELPKRLADHPLPLPFAVGLRLGGNYTSASPLCLHRNVMGRTLLYTIAIHGPLTCAVGYRTQCYVSSWPQKIVSSPHHTNKTSHHLNNALHCNDSHIFLTLCTSRPRSDGSRPDRTGPLGKETSFLAARWATLLPDTPCFHTLHHGENSGKDGCSSTRDACINIQLQTNIALRALFSIYMNIRAACAVSRNLPACHTRCALCYCLAFGTKKVTKNEEYILNKKLNNLYSSRMLFGRSR
jgi:hypothetical protein